MDVRYLHEFQSKDTHEKDDLYRSSSGESIYDAMDRDGKDRFATGDNATQNAMLKLKNAEKIISLNKFHGKEKKTSALVKYFGQAVDRKIPPRNMGFVHKRENP